MLRKRIIPCLDIKDGRTVKGTNFTQLRDAGDPIELATVYSEAGADELVLLDISATTERRSTVVDMVTRVARAISIPFTVGGGISDHTVAYDLLQHGADKVSINSAAVRSPQLIDDIASRYGTQCTVVAIDAKYESGQWQVYSSGGTDKTGRELTAWAMEAQERGSGEILFTSMDHDGTKDGYAIEELRKLCSSLSIPVIASGGAGTMEHIRDVFAETRATGALAASVFHYGEIKIPALKTYLSTQNIPVRL